MDITPLLEVPLAVQVHAFAAVAAFALGALQFAGIRMGRTAHRVLGWSWVALMAIVAGSAMFIREIFDGWLSPIHLFVPLTIVGIAAGLGAIRRGDVSAHRRHMRGVFIGALVIAGAFTFLPGRTMHAVLFG